MTIKGSGPIAVSDVEREINGSSGYQGALSFLRDNGSPSFTNLGGSYNKAWYQSNNQGNCNKAHADAATSTGNIQCQNCTLSTVDCANCQTRSYLQNNCNCACTYNCNESKDQSYNCDCNCNCNCLVCACACW
jgi:hypothetical protein